MGGTFNRKRRTSKHLFACKACGKVILLESDKRWIRSYCATAGKDVRIYRVLTREPKS